MSSMESTTNGKDDEPVAIPEATESDTQTVETRRRPSRRAKVIGGVTLTAILAAGVGGLLYRDKWNDNRDAGRERDEVALLEDFRDDGAPLRDATVILRGGVKVRTTPDTVGSNAWVRSNVDHEVGNGEVSIVSNPIIADLNGEIWMGFTNEAPSTERRSPIELARDMRWVNLGGLEIASEGRDEPYVEYIEAPSDSQLSNSQTINGRIDSFGNVRVIGRENPVAIGVEVEEWQLETITSGLDITSSQG
jgi:hypothetical protein